jgi:hypothetical protein
VTTLLPAELTRQDSQVLRRSIGSEAIFDRLRISVASSKLRVGFCGYTKQSITTLNKDTQGLMNKPQPVVPLPRPDFGTMPSKALLRYIKKNQAYLRSGDKFSTPEECVVTAGLVADRKAEAFAAARVTAEQLDEAMHVANEALQKFPKGPLGLTPDAVKRSPEWLTASRNFTFAFQALRRFNRTYTKTFAEELRHERQIQRASHLTAD